MHVTAVQTLGLEELDDGQLVYVFECSWSDGTTTHIKRKYDALFAFHCKLLDQFADEAGANDHVRIIPQLPGRKLLSSAIFMSSKQSRRTNEEKRMPGVVKYVNELIKLPPKISQSDHVLGLFDDEWFKKPRLQPAPGLPTIAMSGFLTKRGAVNKSWKSRFFALIQDSKTLQYYEGVRSADNLGSSLGSIHLHEVVEVVLLHEATSMPQVQWPKNANPRCCFWIALPSRTFYLFSQEDADAAAWVAAIRQVIAG